MVILFYSIQYKVSAFMINYGLPVLGCNILKNRFVTNLSIPYYIMGSKFYNLVDSKHGAS